MTAGVNDALNLMEPKGDYDDIYFRGTVVDDQDPLMYRRVRVDIPRLYGEDVQPGELPWCRPERLGGRGEFSVPRVGSKVVVRLDNGDPSFPVYVANLEAPADIHAAFKENYPRRFGFADDAGNLFYWDTKTKDVHFDHGSTKFTFHIRPDGTLDVTTKSPVNITCVNVTVNSTGDTVVTSTKKLTANFAQQVILQSSHSVTVTAPVINLN